MLKEFDTHLRKEGPVWRFASYFSLIFVALGLTILLVLYPFPTAMTLLVITSFLAVTLAISSVAVFFSRR